MGFSNSYDQAGTGADEYVRAMIALVAGRNPVEMLEGGVARLREELARIPQDKLGIPEAEGKWSIGDVVRHLAETEMVYGYRIRMVLSHDTPEIQGFDQDKWASLVTYDGATIDEFLSMLEILRNLNLKVYRGLSEDQLHRFGVHTERGPESVGRQIKLCAAHDEVHLRQIQRIASKV
jgi:hypothetical protein